MYSVLKPLGPKWVYPSRLPRQRPSVFPDHWRQEGFPSQIVEHPHARLIGQGPDAQKHHPPVSILVFGQVPVTGTHNPHILHVPVAYDGVIGAGNVLSLIHI